MAGVKRTRPEDVAASSVDEPTALPADAADNAGSLTPLQREILHSQQEKSGLLTFPVFHNDSSEEALVNLIRLKAIFCEQLPKMPKEYISRLVLDRRHVSLACMVGGTIVGGITYRPVKESRLSEIVFCAVTAESQVQGYGTRIMNQIKEECKRTGIEGMLTYADNHAVGYFRKQGFKKQVTMRRERWQGYLKDYEGATLMECLVDPTIDYLSTRQVAERQRKAVVKRIAERAAADGEDDGKGAGASGSASASGKAGKEAANAELLKTGWAPPKLEITYKGEQQALPQHLSELLEAVASHPDAWPFQTPVSVTDAPDYYTVIKNPVDITMLRKRLATVGTAKPYYVTPQQLHSDLYVMCENCKVYNDPATTYWECATRLESFVKARAADTIVKRLAE